MWTVGYGNYGFSLAGAQWHQNILIKLDDTSYFNPNGTGYKDAVKHEILHELGHGVGLNHNPTPTVNGQAPSVLNCYNQTPGGSVMNYGCGVNDLGPSGWTNGTNIPNAVTSCDAGVAHYNTATDAACSYSCYPNPDDMYWCEDQNDFNYFSYQYCDCRSSCEPSENDVFECEHQEDYWYWDYDTCLCTQGASPILIDLDGNELDLTSAARGVRFDIQANGKPMQIGWTARLARDAFLVLDRSGNGSIDDGAELFGNATQQPPPDPGNQPNGFEALAVFDEVAQGGNLDGVITSTDSVFGLLRLWIDFDHNGRSASAELFTLTEMGVRELSLRYQLRVRHDQFGNSYKYWSSVQIAPDQSLEGPTVSRRAIDVYFAVKKR